MAKTMPPSVNQGPSSTNNDTPSSPRKTRRKRTPIPAILSLLLLVALILSQSIFWATRDLLLLHEEPWNTTTMTMTSTSTAASQQTRTNSTPFTATTVAIAKTTTNVSTVVTYNRTVYKFHNDLVRDSPTTVVTAYFQIGSKFPSEKYNQWMTNMLSTQEAMIIFTSHDLVSRMQTLRNHALNRTIVIGMTLSNVPMAQEHSIEFWNHQVMINPERKRHKGYELFWIWLSKSWFVTQAIDGNWFDSSIYMWSDIGCYRTNQYRDQQILIHTNSIVPRHSILQMAHHTPNPPPENDVLWNNKLHDKQHFYHSGSQAIGYKDTWQTFHYEFENTLHDYIKANKFVGEDQTILQSTCIRNPNLCAYISFDQVKDNHYFGLRYALHYGGNYTLWRPPGAQVTLETITTRVI